MNKLIFALALTPALFVTGAFAQTVSDDVTKEIWCGTALVTAFSNPPEGVTSEQMAEGQTYIDGGNALLDDATQKHLDAGFTEEQVTKIKADLVAEITPIVTGSGAEAKYTFEECLALLPGQAAPSGEPALAVPAPADPSAAPAAPSAAPTEPSAAPADPSAAPAN